VNWVRQDLDPIALVKAAAGACRQIAILAGFGKLTRDACSEPEVKAGGGKE